MSKRISFQILVFLTVFLNYSFGQVKIYDFEGKSKENFGEPTTVIEFLPETEGLAKISEANKFGEAGILAIAGAGINYGFKLLSDLQDKRLKKFSKEITTSRINIHPVFTAIPAVSITRKGFEILSTGTRGREQVFFSFDLVPHKVNSENNSFYYEIENFLFNYSEAMLTKKHPLLDLVMEIQIVGMNKEGKRSTFKSSPILVKYINTKKETRPPIFENIRTSIIPRKVSILEVIVKIVETNSTKVSVDQFISSFWKSGEELANIFSVISENYPKDDEEDGGNK